VEWTCASGIAPVIFGYTFDFSGSYSPVLYAAAECFLAAPVVLLTLGRYPEVRAEANSQAARQA